MSKDKQIDVIYEDLVKIFDEKYNRRNLITPQNTAERMTAKGYRKNSDIAREIFEEIDNIADNLMNSPYYSSGDAVYDLAELKKKYIVTDTNDGCKDTEGEK